MSKLYTVVAEYGATGEGTTVMVLITRAIGEGTPEQNALEHFTQVFGGFFKYFADVHEGLKTDFLCANILLSEQLIKTLSNDNAGNISYHASFHVNYS
jgi:hypothetical protein